MILPRPCWIRGAGDEESGGESGTAREEEEGWGGGTRWRWLWLVSVSAVAPSQQKVKSVRCVVVVPLVALWFQVCKCVWMIWNVPYQFLIFRFSTLRSNREAMCQKCIVEPQETTYLSLCGLNGLNFLLKLMLWTKKTTRGSGENKEVSDSQVTVGWRAFSALWSTKGGFAEMFFLAFARKGGWIFLISEGLCEGLDAH